MTGLTFNADATHGTTKSIHWKNPLESPPPKPPFLPARRAPTPFVGCRKQSYQIHIFRIFTAITSTELLDYPVSLAKCGILSLESRLSADSLVHG